MSNAEEIKAGTLKCAVCHKVYSGIGVPVNGPDEVILSDCKKHEFFDLFLAK